MHFELTPATQALLCEVRKMLHKQAGAALDDDTFMDQLLRLAATGATADRKPGTPSYQIAIGVCARCERVTQDGGGRVFDIDPKLLEVALCDASVVALQEPDAPVSRKIPPARRAAVLRRAHGCCEVPGCRAAMWVDVHHSPRPQWSSSHRPGDDARRPGRERGRARRSGDERAPLSGPAAAQPVARGTRRPRPRGADQLAGGGIREAAR